MSARTRPAGGVSATDYLTSVMLCLKRFEHGQISIKFVPFKGWVVEGERRFINDNGEDFAGRNWQEAETFLRWWLK